MSSEPSLHPPPLPLEHVPVWSDHAEVRTASILGVGIASWNVCNPTYMANFTDEDSPFRLTQFAIKKEDIKDNYWLKEKTSEQCKLISDAMWSKAVDVFIIPEAFEDLIELLIASLGLVIPLGTTMSRGIARYRHVLDHNPKREGNHIMIIYNAEKFPDAMTGVRELMAEDTGKPFRVAFLVIPHRGLTVIGVHLPGNAAQYPKGALAALGSWLGPSPVHLTVIGGDWNTKPDRAMLHLTRDSRLLLPALPSQWQPTHVTPVEGEVVVYDYFIAVGGPRNLELPTEQIIGWSSLAYVKALQAYKMKRRGPTQVAETS